MLKPDEKTRGYFQFEKLFETDCCDECRKSEMEDIYRRNHRHAIE